MNKWVFMLLATLFNLALVLGFFVIFMVIASLIKKMGNNGINNATRSKKN